MANPMKSRSGQNDGGSKPRGGVGEHGMPGRWGALSGEISRDGPEPNARPNGTTPEAATVRGEVGSVHSSRESGNDTGAKGPNLNAGCSGATDEAMAPLLGIRTPLKVQALQRTLYRKAGPSKRRQVLTIDKSRSDPLALAHAEAMAHRVRGSVLPCDQPGKLPTEPF